MAKVVYAHPTENDSWGFGTSLVPLEDVEDELEKRKKQQDRDGTE